MANRFQSIVDNLAAAALADVKELYPRMIRNEGWKIVDGGLVVTVNGEEYEFTLENGDPDSEALLILLNNLHYLMQAIGAPR